MGEMASQITSLTIDLQTDSEFRKQYNVCWEYQFCRYHYGVIHLFIFK